MDIVATKYDYPGPTTLRSPQDAVTYVLENVGTTFPARDGVDDHLVSEVRSWGTEGQLVNDETASPMFGPGYVADGTAPADADGDGIPDAWELEAQERRAVQQVQVQQVPVATCEMSGGLAQLSQATQRVRLPRVGVQVVRSQRAY